MISTYKSKRPFPRQTNIDVIMLLSKVRKVGISLNIYIIGKIFTFLGLQVKLSLDGLGLLVVVSNTCFNICTVDWLEFAL